MSKNSEVYKRLDKTYGHLSRARFEVETSLMKDSLTPRQREDIRVAAEHIAEASEAILLTMTQEELNENSS